VERSISFLCLLARSLGWFLGWFLGRSLGVFPGLGLLTTEFGVVIGQV
jgi:hypothetical protein